MPVATQPAHTSRALAIWREPGFVLSAVVALAIGVYVGRLIAYYFSAGGESVIGGSLLIVLTVLGIVVAAIAWPVIARVLGRSPGHALGSVLMATIPLGAGLVGGAATASLTGGAYHPAITLEAPATIQANLSGAGLAMATVDGAAGRCESDPDGRSIGSITALDLGAFGSGRLRGYLAFSANGTVDGWAMIDGSDNDPEALPIQWAGTLRVMSMSPDRSSGDVFFPDVPLGLDSKLPDATIGPEWPRAISGDISWQCEPFPE